MDICENNNDPARWHRPCSWGSVRFPDSTQVQARLQQRPFVRQAVRQAKRWLGIALLGLAAGAPTQAQNPGALLVMPMLAYSASATALQAVDFRSTAKLTLAEAEEALTEVGGTLLRGVRARLTPGSGTPIRELALLRSSFPSEFRYRATMGVQAGLGQLNDEEHRLEFSKLRGSGVSEPGYLYLKLGFKF